MKFLPQFLLILCCFFLLSCKEDKKENKETMDLVTRPKKDYIRKIPGKNDTIPEQVAQKGEVLIAYSDCYDCHTVEKRSKGPAFKDIAKRYPVNDAFINMLAYRVIYGGNGAWGYPVMSPHPKLSHEEAKIMVSYILSLKEE
jgi:cytochrome c